MPLSNNFTERSGLERANRDRIDIIESILEICENGSLKTHIMFSCDLNSKQVSRYIQFLENQKLLESDAGSPYSNRLFYKITEKGKKYIEAYGQLEEIFK